MQKTVFISWSGPQSEHIAKCLEEGLSFLFRPEYLQIWRSAQIAPGVRWNNTISQYLQQANYGILCLTRENLNRPWIHFEAGAISKVLDDSQVCPYLYDVDELLLQQGPLGQFQAVRADKEGTLKLVYDLHALLNPPLFSLKAIDGLYNLMWKELSICLSKTPKGQPIERSDFIRYFSELRKQPAERSIEPYELTAALNIVIRGILQELCLTWSPGPGVDYKVVIGNKIVLLETKVRGVKDKNSKYYLDAIEQMEKAINEVHKDENSDKFEVGQVIAIIVIPDYPERSDEPKSDEQNIEFFHNKFLFFCPISELKRHLKKYLDEMLKQEVQLPSNATADESSPG